MRQTSNLVDVLQRQSQRLVSRTFRWLNVIKGVHDCHALLLAILHLPALEPRHLRTPLQHVVAMPAGHRHKRYGVGVVAYLLDVCRHLLVNFIESSLPAHVSRHYSISIITTLPCLRVKGMHTKDVKGLPGAGNRLPKWTGYQTKSFRLHNTYLLIGDSESLIYELHTRWSQNKQSHNCNSYFTVKYGIVSTRKLTT